MSKILPTENQDWGFWGTMREQAAPAWPIAFTAIHNATSTDPASVRAFLDSRYGRHFADGVNGQMHYSASLADAIAKTTAEWMGWRITQRTSRETGIIARNMRMEGCSPFAARHTAAATDCEYDVAWAQSYSIGVDYTPSATRAGNAVFNRHRAPTSRLTRLLAHIPNIRAAAFWQSSTEIGVEGACMMATSTTAETAMAALSWNGLNGITPTARGLLLNPNRGVGFVVQTTHAKEFALAHWLVGGADGGRLCLRCFDGAGIVRENIAGDALASGTTLQWAPTSKTWQAGAVMQESDLNRRQTVRFGPEVAFAQIGIIGFDGQIEVEALRLYGLPEDAPAVLSGCPALPAGGRTLMFSASWDLPSMPPGATTNADWTCRGFVPLL